MTSYQKLLAQLGMSYAHPGGKAATSLWMELLPVTNFGKILEIGCGIGQTLLAINNKTDADITGVDIHPQMTKKARMMTEKISTIDIVEASAENLPFEDDQFHLIVCESVLTFTNANKSMSEISRVLCDNGTVVLLEMTADPQLDQLDKDIIQNFYEIPQLFTRFEWLKLLLENGFTDVTLKQVHKNNVDSLPANQNIQWTDTMLKTIETHYHVNKQYGNSLQACLFLASKAVDTE
ncbi:methyltransferase domain-containing protein [Gracilibacillus oryzae]|uniref:Methyltransferase domain-containing protein n=1 Tax=Gracilibacillus oryzae TaxID=1672701 RepID=A0A7C8KST4_9BACI|nr:class I SAM-dependent methyltransferase [Gracilibacillus oryzae]KAB8137522.1 methyltransferase domain-containing protein [Gracilibacillus oryzae]